MCRTHVVWIKCGEIETETLGKAKAHLLPLVILQHIHQIPHNHCGLIGLILMSNLDPASMEIADDVGKCSVPPVT